MKKVFVLLSIALTVGLLSSSCVPYRGMAYEDITVSQSVTSNMIGDNAKVGRSSYISVLGIVAIGDSGVNAAAKEAGIKKISHVDVKKTSYLGVFTKTETIVYGE